MFDIDIDKWIKGGNQMKDCHTNVRPREEGVSNAAFWDIEIVNEPTGEIPEFAIFDFDGTVSLLREGWQPIMYDFFTEELCKCKDAPARDESKRIVMDFVDKLTGKQTIFQCMQLCEEMKKYGGVPEEPLAYKTEYLNRLMAKIKDRRDGLRDGSDPAPHLVPGVCETLKALNDLHVKCFLTSGTDEADVLEEAQLLGVADYFESIHGATDANSTSCSKEKVLHELIESRHLQGTKLLGFGDGYVEIELTKNVGGYAVAVATAEDRKDGSVNAWKRQRLLSAGADCVIPDFSNTHRLMQFILRR